MIKAVVFDLDDTLYLERDYVNSGFQAVDSFLQQQNIEGFFAAAWSYFEAGGRGNTFNVVLGQLGVVYDKPFIMSLISVYREHNPAITLLPDAVDIIEWLKGRYSLGLITDGFKVAQNNKVDALQLRNILDKVVVTDELGDDREFWKPHSRPYESIQMSFSVPHSACVYIGDNGKKDFVMANKLGWKTVQICREGAEYLEQNLPDGYDADYKIVTMNELPELLTRF